jgi:ATP-binding cassette subfamily C protein
MGLLSPDEGRVLVDGSPLAPGSLSAWRGGIGYVPQETVLFAGTVRDNLAMLAPEAGEPMMWDALEAADLKHRVMEMPGGLDTDIGERGSTLSGGERQRLALARALIRRPRFLVLDEATSELDPVSQRAIRRALERLKGQTTLLVIAHRLSTIRAADTILVMEGGRLIDQGHWDDLARRERGAFHDLLDAETVL